MDEPHPNATETTGLSRKVEREEKVRIPETDSVNVSLDVTCV